MKGTVWRREAERKCMKVECMNGIVWMHDLEGTM